MWLMIKGNLFLIEDAQVAAQKNSTPSLAEEIWMIKGFSYLGERIALPQNPLSIPVVQGDYLCPAPQRCCWYRTVRHQRQQRSSCFLDTSTHLWCYYHQWSSNRSRSSCHRGQTHCSWSVRSCHNSCVWWNFEGWGIRGISLLDYCSQRTLSPLHTVTVIGLLLADISVVIVTIILFAKYSVII